MTLYHLRWTWSRRWRRWRFVLRYRLGQPLYVVPAGVALLALLGWWQGPRLYALLSGWRQSYCVLYLMLFESLQGVWGC